MELGQHLGDGGQPAIRSNAEFGHGVTLERRPQRWQDRHLTLTMSENVTVNTAGGTPTLTLNDGGTATYTAAPAPIR